MWRKPWFLSQAWSLRHPPVTSRPSIGLITHEVQSRSPSFSGEAASCSGFLLQCSLYLEMQPHLFVTERAKVSFIISLLSGRALQWAESPWIHSLDGFVKHFREVFGQSTTEF
uniref:DUF4939 domain-containing protein n=1 Tax=Sinocyclocheilus rhinocerous TaxID=307959 RepID=A0A673JVB1_9TELE